MVERTAPVGEHGAGCGCGLDVSSFERILDAAAVAEHVGISRGGLRAAQMRAEGKVDGKSAPVWWKAPIVFLIAGAHVWDLRDAEVMRVAYAEWQRERAERGLVLARLKAERAARRAAAEHVDPRNT